MNKTCSCCLTERPISDFQKRTASKDGLTASCKSCLKKRDAEKHVRFREKRLMTMREYAKTPKAKESHAMSVKKWARSNREKRYAHSVVSHAVAAGKIKKEPCKVCGNEKVEAHHHDYSLPMHIIWLCSSCHKKAHSQNDFTF